MTRLARLVPLSLLLALALAPPGHAAIAFERWARTPT
jgi:hypothetical protein